jgi:hypothetical protein
MSFSDQLSIMVSSMKPIAAAESPGVAGMDWTRQQREGISLS